MKINVKKNEMCRGFAMLLAIVMVRSAFCGYANPAFADGDFDVPISPGTILIDYVDYMTGATVAPSVVLDYDNDLVFDPEGTGLSGPEKGDYIPCPSVNGKIVVACYYYVPESNEEGYTPAHWQVDGNFSAEGGGMGTCWLLNSQDRMHYRVFYDNATTVISNPGTGLGGVSFLFMQADSYEHQEVAQRARYVYGDGDRSVSMTPPTVSGMHAVSFARYVMPSGWTPAGAYTNMFTMEDYVSLAFGWADGDTSNSEDFVPLQTEFAFNTSVTEGDWTVYVVGYEQGSEPDPNVATFDAALIVPSASTIPSVAVNFSIAGIPADIAAVPGVSRAILSPNSANGVAGTPTVGSAAFAPTDSTVTSAAGFAIVSGNKASVQTVPIDFNGVTFTRPGIYRYIITEPSSGNNLRYDTQWSDSANSNPYQRVLDVYVLRDANDNYNIGGYVVRESNGSAGDGTTVADKSAGFAHELSVLNLDISATVEGNQAALDKYFAFTVTITGPAGAEFTVNADWENGSTAPAPGFSSRYTAAEMAEGNTASWTSNENGVITHTFYLKHQQGVTISGIPAGSGYNISVAQEDYLPSWEIGSDSAETATTGGHMLTANTSAQFVLENNGMVPTGVVLSIIPGVLIAAGALMVIVAVRQGKKKTEKEEE